MYIVYVMFVQNFGPQGRRFTNFPLLFIAVLLSWVTIGHGTESEVILWRRKKKKKKKQSKLVFRRVTMLINSDPMLIQNSTTLSVS